MSSTCEPQCECDPTLPSKLDPTPTYKISHDIAIANTPPPHRLSYQTPDSYLYATRVSYHPRIRIEIAWFGCGQDYLRLLSLLLINSLFIYLILVQ